MSGPVYRCGTIADLQGIRKLQEECSFLKGFDYLSTVVPHWIHSKLFQIHIMEHRGNIVGMYASMRAPGSKVISLVGLRIHPDYRGTDVFERLMRHGFEQIKRQNPDVECQCIDSLKSAYWDSEIAKGKLKLHRTWAAVVHTEVPRDRFDRFILQHDCDVSARRLSPSDVIRLTDDGSIQDVLMKGGTYFIPSHGWLTLPVNKETIRYASTLGNIHVTRVNDTDQSQKLKGVSFGHMMMTDSGRVRIDICYYGDEIDDFQRHMTSHLRHSLSVSTSSKFILTVRHSVDKVKVADDFNKLFGKGEMFSKDKNPKVNNVYLMTMPPAPHSKL